MRERASSTSWAKAGECDLAMISYPSFWSLVKKVFRDGESSIPLFSALGQRDELGKADKK
jgi:hypothetical protein